MSGVINGGFETGDFQGWEIGALPQLELPSVAPIAHSGTHSALLKTGAFIRQTYHIPIKSVESLEYWASSTGTGSLIVTVYFADPRRIGFYLWSRLWKGLLIRGAGIMEPGDGPWHRYILKTSPPKPEAPVLKPIWGIRFECAAGETMGVYLDDVSFRRSMLSGKPL